MHNGLFVDESEEKQAIRAYLQRGEVRLSTMHRIAGVFLNGAGLLLLVNIIFKDSIASVLNDTSILSFIWPLVAVVALSILPTILGLYFLIADLVHFYFTSHDFGEDTHSYFIPRFILSGIPLSPDESPNVRRIINELQEGKTEESLYYIRRLMVSADDKENAELWSTYRTLSDQAIPTSRRDRVSDIGPTKLEDDPDDLHKTEREVICLYTAFQLTGTTDRTLIEEAAKMEVSLVRHAYNLRRLVLRYSKAILLAIWTMMFCILSIVLIGKSVELVPVHGNPTETVKIIHKDLLICAGFVYALWAVSTPYIVQIPMYLIYKQANKKKKREAVFMDKGLFLFENMVFTICIVTSICCRLLTSSLAYDGWLLGLYNSVCVIIPICLGVNFLWRAFKKYNMMFWTFVQNKYATETPKAKPQSHV